MKPETYLQTEVYTGEYDLVKKIMLWPREKIFPVLDLFRLFVLHPGSIELFRGSDYGANYTSVILGTLANSTELPSIVTAFKVLSNIFKNAVGQFCMKLRRQTVLECSARHITHQHKLVRTSLAGVLLNYSVLFCTDNDPEGRVAILDTVTTMLGSETEQEIIFRLFVTLGNLLIGGGV
jgi:phospholipase A-2-activating protein